MLERPRRDGRTTDGQLAELRAAALGGSVSAAYPLAVLLTTADLHSEAAEWFQIAVTAGPAGGRTDCSEHLAVAYVELDFARCLIAAGRHNEAEQHLAAAVRGDLTTAQLELAAWYTRVGYPEAAERTYRALAERGLREALDLFAYMTDEYKTYRHAWGEASEAFQAEMSAIQAMVRICRERNDGVQAERWLRAERAILTTAEEIRAEHQSELAEEFDRD